MKRIDFDCGNYKHVIFVDQKEDFNMVEEYDSIEFTPKHYNVFIMVSNDFHHYERLKLNLCEVQLPNNDLGRTHEIFEYHYKWIYPSADCYSAGDLKCWIEVPDWMYQEYMDLKMKIRPFQKY